MYWKSATRKSVSLLCPDQEYLIAGITDQVMICIKRTKEMSDESKVWNDVSFNILEKQSFLSTHEYGTYTFME
jgi:hypothetical protein